MVSRITAALAARYKAIQEKEKGFTLIELLVVVIIIGVLAAIAIPVYLGVQSNAVDSAVKSDLTNVKSAVVAYQTDPANTLSTTTTVTSLGSTVTIDAGNYASAADQPTLEVTGTGSSLAFCVEAKGSNGNTFHVTDKKAPTTGPCP